MDRGQKIAEGPPEDVLTEDHLRRVFGITAHITQSEQGLIFQALDGSGSRSFDNLQGLEDQALF